MEKKKPPHSRVQPKSRNGKLRIKTLGPVFNLEEHVSPDWWNRIFNHLYLKTDGDVVDDLNITRSEVDQITEILGLSARHRILDLCCGQGRHALELTRRGFRNVEGIDRSHYLIQKARECDRNEGLGVRFREGDARKLLYQADIFDTVLILGNSFGYFETLQDDLRVLREVRRVLKPWGKLLIDMADGEYLKSNFQPRSWEWINNKLFVCRERELSLDGERLVSREVITHVEKGIIADQFYAERLYSRERISRLLGEAGFSAVAFPLELSPDSQRAQDLGMMERRIVVTTQVRKEWTPITRKAAGVERHVAVILGDPKKQDRLKPSSVFDEDDFYTIDRMKEALRELDGYRFTYLDNHDTLIQDLGKLVGKIDYALNLCDEGYNNNPRMELHVPALLESLGISYTGSGPQCLGYCYDKSLVRGAAKEVGIPVPEAFFVSPEDTAFELPFDFPVIVKPILVEEFLTGKDLSVGLIGTPPSSYVMLPIIEEDYSCIPKGMPHICGYEAKWDPESAYWKIKSVPADLPEEVERAIVGWCVELAGRLECLDYARMDWRLDASGTPKLLEVNPNPGWCWDGHLAKMAAHAGLNYSELLGAILRSAEVRLGLKTGGEVPELKARIGKTVAEKGQKEMAEVD